MNHTLSLLLLLLVAPALKAAGQSLDILQNRFTVDVRILTPADYLPQDVLRTLERTHAQSPGPVAVGTLDGVTFLYRSNGVALFATTEAQDWQKMSRTNSWAIDCSKDAMEDFVTCRLTREDFALALTDSGYVALVIGTNHYPGSAVAIRVDQDAPLSIAAPGFGQSQANDIVQRLTAGHSLTTRYEKWPYRANIDRKMDLYGFSEALKFLNWVLTRFK